MITVYSKPRCVQCAATKQSLQARGIPFREIDLTEDRAAEERVRAWGYRQVPVVDVGPDQHWFGFRPDLISDLVPYGGADAAQD